MLPANLMVASMSAFLDLAGEDTGTPAGMYPLLLWLNIAAADIAHRCFAPGEYARAT